MAYFLNLRPECRRLFGAAAFGLLWLTVPCRAARRPTPRQQVRRAAPGVSQAIWNAIHDASVAYGVDANFLAAVIRQESNFQPLALSNKGAMGLMQLMPETAWRLGVRNPFDPRENTFAGTRYLSLLLHRYHGNASLALAAYSAGAGAVDKHRGIPPYPETINYVNRITYLYQTHTLHIVHSWDELKSLNSAAPILSPSILGGHVPVLTSSISQTSRGQ